MRDTIRGQVTMPATKSVSKYNLVHRLQGRSLLIAINCLASLSIFFFGYDQGMMVWHIVNAATCWSCSDVLCIIGWSQQQLRLLSNHHENRPSRS